MQTLIKYFFPVMYVLYIVGIFLNVRAGNNSEEVWIISAVLWMFNYHMLYRKGTK